MNPKLKDKLVEQLFEALALIKTSEESQMFLEDICTISEIKALAQRLEVAKMLQAGATYIEIGEKTGASTATISRVNRALNYGADGYKLVLERLSK